MPKEQNNLEIRVEEFNKELKVLLGKYKLGLIVTPQFIPDQAGGWRTNAILQVIDDKKEAGIIKN